MRIMLIGGGSGGHITPLLAVARELKSLRPEIELIGVCEKNAAFAHLFKEENAIDHVEQISAGKYRRYSGLSAKEKLTDIKTPLLNTRDAARTVKGYAQARRLLKRYKPDAMLIKGGFVAVPLGLAAARLNIPYMTHDSDSVPGLANRIVSRWAKFHATGMPAELYGYPKSTALYTGIPVSENFTPVSEEDKLAARKAIGIENADPVIAVVGGSQGGSQLNEDSAVVFGELIKEFPDLGVVHFAGAAKQAETEKLYRQYFDASHLERILIKGYANDLYNFSASADVIISRAGATAIAEFSLQGKALILVPGRLAGDHQDKNAEFFAKNNAAVKVAYGDREGLSRALRSLLSNREARDKLGANLINLSKPNASKELAVAVLGLAEGKRSGEV